MIRAALVTGATGTVGSAVIPRLLEAGVAVTALVRSRDVSVPGAQLVVGDLSDPAALARAARGAEVIVHCAAALSDDPAESRRVNVEGTRRVVEAALATRARLVHLSTVSVYARNQRSEFDEDSPLLTGPPDDYGRSKAEAERIVREGETRGVVAVILRPVIVLSVHPRSYWGPRAAERARAQPGLLVPIQEVPYVHVMNLVDAIWLAATRTEAAGGAYNVIDGYGPAQEYADVIYTVIGRPPPRIPPDAPRIRYAGERIRTELGYAPRPLWRDFLGELAALRR